MWGLRSRWWRARDAFEYLLGVVVRGNRCGGSRSPFCFVKVSAENTGRVKLQKLKVTGKSSIDALCTCYTL